MDSLEPGMEGAQDQGSGSMWGGRLATLFCDPPSYNSSPSPNYVPRLQANWADSQIRGIGQERNLRFIISAYVALD